jgi:putative redox protein
MFDVSVESMEDDYKEKLVIGSHQVILDSSKELQGQNEGPSPHDLLTGALLGCKAMTMRMYAKRKGWDLTGLRITGRQMNPERGLTEFEVRIYFPKDLGADECQRLIEVSKKCPVHRSLEGQVTIDTKIAE